MPMIELLEVVLQTSDIFEKVTNYYSLHVFPALLDHS